MSFTAKQTPDTQWWWRCKCGSEGRKKFETRRLAEIAAHTHDRKCGGYAKVTCLDPQHDTEDDMIRFGHFNCMWCDDPCTKYCDGVVLVRYDYRRVRCDAPLCDAHADTSHMSHIEETFDFCPFCATRKQPRPAVQHYTLYGRPVSLAHDRKLLSHVRQYRRGRMALVHTTETQ